MSLSPEPPQPARIALSVNHLVDGGAARVVANLSRAWTEMGRQVTVLTMDDGSRPPIYPLHPGVRHLPLALHRPSSGALEAAAQNLARLLRLRRALREVRPDLLVSFLDTDNVRCLLATRGMRRLPVIVSERTDPHGRSIGRFWEALRLRTYPWAACVVTQTRHAMEYFPEAVRARGRVIPNPVLRPEAGDPEPGTPGRQVLVTLGRMQPVKGHDMLIEAFSRIAARFPAWDLHIHGDGPSRDALAGLVRERGLEGRVLLGRNVADVGRRLREADLFVLPSRVEGFPNALAEAMAWGLPVISFDCASGPADLIRPGLDGLLVPPGDVPALAAAMARLMADPEERKRLAARAPEVLERFSQDRIMDLWESALQSALSGARRIQPAPERP